MDNAVAIGDRNDGRVSERERTMLKKRRRGGANAEERNEDVECEVGSGFKFMGV